MPEGKKLIELLGSRTEKYLLMDRAYEDTKTKTLALKGGFIPVVLPKSIENTMGIRI